MCACTSNLIYRADMAHGAGDSGVRYCTLHTAHCTLHAAESGVCLGLAETESTRGRGLRLPFAKQEVRVVHLVLQTIGCRGQRAKGRGHESSRTAPHRTATDRCHSKCLTRAGHQRGTCKYMHAVSWNSEATVDHQDSATTGKQVVGLVGRQRGQIQTRKRRDDGVQEEDGRTAEGDRQDQNREGRIWGV